MAAENDSVERVNWRDLPPLSEADQALVRIPEVPSQTFLKVHDACDRAAYLHLLHHGGPGGHELNRGAIVHETLDRLTRWLISERERAGGYGGLAGDYAPTAEERREQAMSQVPPEIGKQVLAEVMAEHPEYQIPAKERDACRYMVDHWCRGTYFNKPIIGVEITLSLVIEGFRVLIRLDLVETNGTTCEITDYKTEFPPSADEFEQQAFDANGNPRWAGNFQLNMAAVVAAYGVAEDGLPLGNFDRYRLHLEYPRVLKPEGIARRTVDVTPLQIESFREDLELQLRRLREVNIGQRKWQATPGTHCRICPCEYECPLPVLLRPESQHANLDSIEDLEKAATSQDFMAKRASNLKARIKKAAQRMRESDPEALRLPNGDEGVYCGTNLALIFLTTEKEEVIDKPAFRKALEATRFGERVDPADHYRYRESVSFEKRKVPPRAQNGDTQ